MYYIRHHFFRIRKGNLPICIPYVSEVAQRGIVRVGVQIAQPASTTFSIRREWHTVARGVWTRAVRGASVELRRGDGVSVFGNNMEVLRGKRFLR